MKKLLSITLLALSIFAYMAVYATTIQSELSDNLLRFHILANSDSEHDQGIKLAVRDYVSKGLAGETLSPDSSEYAKRVEQLANEYLANNNIEYSAVATKECVYIPQKSYKDITLPSGNYNAIKLSLGEGKGENWWCVAYPSLCFNEAYEGSLSENARAILEKNISDEGYFLITEKPKYRFFAVDMICKIFR